jgi:hypothetical protein
MGTSLSEAPKICIPERITVISPVDGQKTVWLGVQARLDEFRQQLLPGLSRVRFPQVKDRKQTDNPQKNKTRSMMEDRVENEKPCLLLLMKSQVRSNAFFRQKPLKNYSLFFR